MRSQFLQIIGALAAGLLSLATAKADFISDTLASAGPSHWAVLTLNGAQDVALNGPGTTNGNVGISSGGNLQLNASNNSPVSNTAIVGNVFLATGASVNNTAQVSGTVSTSQDALLNQANTDADNAATTFAGLSPTQSVSGNAVNGTTTVSAANPGGLNVINLTGINLGNGQSLTLSGPAGTEFVINDSGGLTLNSGHINLAGGVSVNDVVFNLSGSGNIVMTSGGLNNEPIINGILLTPNGGIAMAPGLINGELIAGGHTVHLVSGASVNQVPEPSSFLLLFTALAPVGAAIYRRRSLK